MIVRLERGIFYRLWRQMPWWLWGVKERYIFKKCRFLGFCLNEWMGIVMSEGRADTILCPLNIFFFLFLFFPMTIEWISSLVTPGEKLGLWYISTASSCSLSLEPSCSQNCQLWSLFHLLTWSETDPQAWRFSRIAWTRWVYQSV